MKIYQKENKRINTKLGGSHWTYSKIYTNYYSKD